jgi:hypothetical protein
MSNSERDPDFEEDFEELTSAWRPTEVRGGVSAHPLWHDLDEDQREEAFHQSLLQRELEAALDAEGLSSTARAVLARIRSA